MSCRRCRGPDSGTTDLCSPCEFEVEQEQNREDELETGRPWAEGHPHCWFAEVFADAGPCEGRLVKCHLVPRQQIRLQRYPLDGNLTVPTRAALAKQIDDPRSWVWGCGGIMGPGGHHGQYKPDGPRLIPRSLLPAGLEVFCAELGLEWWLERTYGLNLDESEAA